jgi:hypothetical protein
MKKKSAPVSSEYSDKYFIDFYKSNYLKFETNVNIKNYINDKNNDKYYLYGNTYNRLNTMETFGYELNLDILNTTTSVFKIRDMKDEIEAIFAFVYYGNPSSTNKAKVEGTNLSMKNMTVGGSYTSKDGEYRSNIIRPYNLKLMQASVEISAIYNDILSYVKKNMVTRKYMITCDNFFPTDDIKQSEIGLEYYSAIFGADLFVYSWLIMMYNIDLNILENNINEKYQTIMLKHKDEDIAFYNIIKKKHKQENIELFRNTICNIRRPESNMFNTKLGQKIIPLTISEARNPFNVRYAPWREYMISIHLSDLVVNNISPGFFITNKWIYIKNARKGLFDNDIQYEKMHRSELADQIITLLSRADAYTHANIKDKKKVAKFIDKNMDSWLSNKFKVLSTKIKDPIDYAKTEIIMSDIALVLFSEYVGRTILDVVNLSKSSVYYNKLIGDPFSEKGYSIFNKYMFDICYNLYCMNYISGVIHGDLHLNNATLKASLYKDVRDIDSISKPTVLYVLGNSDHEQFLFHTSSYNICIIDFSRSIILPEKIEKLRDISIPLSYEVITNKTMFHAEQVDRLLHIYTQLISDTSNEDDLRILFKNKFEAVFKLLSASDIYGFTSKLLSIFNINDKNIIKPHKTCIELLKRINDESEYFILSEMNKLIANSSYEKTILEMEWPMFTIIKKCFSDNTATDELGTIIDIFNINNPLKYSLMKLDKFPSLITDSKANNYKSAIEKRKNVEKENTESMRMINIIANKQNVRQI